VRDVKDRRGVKSAGNDDKYREIITSLVKGRRNEVWVGEHPERQIERQRDRSVWEDKFRIEDGK
jgi:hypothetical protein